MRISRTWLIAVLSILPWVGTCRMAFAQNTPAATPPQPSAAAARQLAILDTDIGDDIDDAFALALVLQSPEVKLLGITTTFGDTELRARLVDRYMAALGLGNIPVAVGRATPQSNVFSQAAYARHEPDHVHANAVDFLLDQIKAHPGEITLIEIGPMVNVQDAFARDPETFRKLKRVVLMGGSIDRGYDTADSNHTPPDAEWNIARDPAGAQALLASGVPVYILPLDSTQIHLLEPERERIFSHGSFLTDQLTLLYHQWAAFNENHTTTPTLFDPVAAAYAVHPEICPMQPIRITVDDKGFTRRVDGPPNAQVCLHSDPQQFLDFYLDRVAR